MMMLSKGNTTFQELYSHACQHYRCQCNMILILELIGGQIEPQSLRS